MAARIAVVGATGLVGEALLDSLADAGYSADEVLALATEASQGKRLEFGKGYLKVEAVTDNSFDGVEVALLAVPAAAAGALAPRIAAAGCVAVDLSGVLLSQPDVVVCLPLVNPEAVEQARESNLVSVPGVAASLTAAVLHPLREILRPVAVDLTMLYPASMAGRAGVEELAGQTGRLLGSQQPEPGLFPSRLAFSLVSPGGAPLGSGPVAPDALVDLALRRLYPVHPLMTTSQSVVLPVFFGAALGLSVHGAGQLDLATAQQMLASSGFEVAEVEAQGISANLLEGLEDGAVRISALQVQGGEGSRLQAWVSADNVRTVAARNGVQIVQLLLKDYS